jgi:flagellar hook-length control protein FliK
LQAAAFTAAGTGLAPKFAAPAGSAARAPPPTPARGAERPASISTVSAEQAPTQPTAAPRDIVTTVDFGSNQHQAPADRSSAGLGAELSPTGNRDVQRDAQRGVPLAVAAVSVVTQETHAAPVMALSPVQQIAESIINAAGGAEPTQIPSRAAPLVPPAQRSLPALQVLNIRLDPPDLGAISIKMRLTGTKLDLHIEVGQKDTVPLLGKDGDSLSSQLQSSGYTVDNLTIKAAETNGIPAQHQHDPAQGQAQGQQSAFQSPGNSNQAGTGPGGDARPNDRQAAGANGGAQPSSSNEVTQDGALAPQNSLGGDLYV